MAFCIVKYFVDSQPDLLSLYLRKYLIEDSRAISSLGILFGTTVKSYFDNRMIGMHDKDCNSVVFEC